MNIYLATVTFVVFFIGLVTAAGMVLADSHPMLLWFMLGILYFMVIFQGFIPWLIPSWRFRRESELAFYWLLVAEMMVLAALVVAFWFNPSIGLWDKPLGICLALMAFLIGLATRCVNSSGWMEGGYADSSVVLAVAAAVLFSFGPVEQVIGGVAAISGILMSILSTRNYRADDIG